MINSVPREHFLFTCSDTCTTSQTDEQTDGQMETQTTVSCQLANNTTNDINISQSSAAKRLRICDRRDLYQQQFVVHFLLLCAN